MRSLAYFFIRYSVVRTVDLINIDVHYTLSD
jgi:hypothetical protein